MSASSKDPFSNADDHSVDEFTRAVLRVAKHLKEQSAKVSLDQEEQMLLGKLINALPAIERIRDSLLLERLEISTQALNGTNKNYALSNEIANGILKDVGVYDNFFMSLFYGRLPSAIPILIGALIMVILIFPFAIIPDPSEALKILPGSLSWKEVSIVLLFGSLGGFVSITTRISELDRGTRQSSLTSILTGFFKPLIGAVFSFIIYLVHKSSIIFSVNIPDSEVQYYYAIVAFICGFSERFALNVVRSTEGKLQARLGGRGDG